MISMLHFRESKVDYVVVECGMGGRYDGTNILKKPECTAIASIGFDHMEILGDTLEKIAYEKAGIMKSGVPCVVGPTVI
jgi:folylpolyglutamate synthase/dihydropteroate synthase